MEYVERLKQLDLFQLVFYKGTLVSTPLLRWKIAIMRIELILENPQPTWIPFDYNHPLASCIYQSLGASSGEYADDLHDHGVAFQGKHFKLFTFSQLLADGRPEIDRRRGGLIFRSPTIRWQISSPVDEFVTHFANGILSRGVVSVRDATFPVREVRTLAPPQFTSTMHFKCLSAITVSTHIDTAGLNPLQYCRIENGFYEKVAENLRRKHELLALGESEPNSSLITGHSSLTMTFDPDYVARHRIDKLIDYKGTKIFAYLCPFTVTGDPGLIRIGYECGFGDGNSKGFGRVEVDHH